jgi:hypothetical protein
LIKKSQHPKRANQKKNQVFIQFYNPSSASAVAVDLPVGGGFFVDLRVRDTLSGPQ